MVQTLQIIKSCFNSPGLRLGLGLEFLLGGVAPPNKLSNAPPPPPPLLLEGLEGRLEGALLCFDDLEERDLFTLVVEGGGSKISESAELIGELGDPNIGNGKLKSCEDLFTGSLVPEEGGGLDRSGSLTLERVVVEVGICCCSCFCCC